MMIFTVKFGGTPLWDKPQLDKNYDIAEPEFGSAISLKSAVKSPQKGEIPGTLLWKGVILIGFDCYWKPANIENRFIRMIWFMCIYIYIYIICTRRQLVKLFSTAHTTDQALSMADRSRRWNCSWMASLARQEQYFIERHVFNSTIFPFFYSREVGLSSLKGKSQQSHCPPLA